MSALVFVDTNVFLYTVDARDLAKQAQAREWVRWCWTQAAGRISTQVLNEFYNNAITKFRAVMPVQQARTQVRNLRQWQPP
ncbi:MAG: PIN domain nuclease, partial [Pseudomonadota bacterium]|nr:PIN domain nuclease [Pseudomonadota bacterium]